MKTDDKRRSCVCSHRWGDHTTKGVYRDRPSVPTRCLAWVNDPGKSSLQMCECPGWTPKITGCVDCGRALAVGTKLYHGGDWVLRCEEHMRAWRMRPLVGVS